MRKLLLTGVALAWVGLTAQANAALTVVVSSGPNYGFFDGYLGDSDFTEAGVTFSGTGVVVQGTTSLHAAPAGDTSPYLAVSKGESETATFGGPTTSILLYWGSIDGNVKGSVSYGNDNTLKFYDGTTLVATVDGEYLLAHGLSPATGNRVAADTNEWISISGITFTKVVATSTGNSFELDAAKAIPEAPTWAMMVLGFAGLGYAAFRRGVKDRASAVAI